jgi:hypothetical protein
MRSFIHVAALSALVSGPFASAAPLTFLGQDFNSNEAVRLASTPNANAARTAFLSNLSGVGTETFEGFANGTSLVSPGITVSFGGGNTATLTGPDSNSFVNEVSSGTVSGRYPISGTKYVEAGRGLSLSFSQPQVAFGFYGTDIGDFNGQVTLTLADGSSTLVNIGNSTNINGGAVLYFGLINPVPFTAISFGNTSGGTDFFGFDDFTIGRPDQVRVVPLPAAAFGGLLMLAGLAAPRALRRRAQP